MLKNNVVKTIGTEVRNKQWVHVGHAPCGFYRPCEDEDGQVANKLQKQQKNNKQTKKLLWLFINLWLTSVLLGVGGEL